MIRRLPEIRGFGIFRDFRWDEPLPDFECLNLLYGWNYSGKTTLSRVFQAMEAKSVPPAHSSGYFVAAIDGQPALNSRDLAASPPVRVFNAEFVRRNFQQEHTAPAVFIIGEENVVLRNRLDIYRSRRDRVARLEKEYRDRRNELEARFQKAGTDRARDVGELLGARNFRRPDLEARLAQVRSNPDRYALSEDDVSTRLQTVRSLDHYEELQPLTMDLPDLVGLSQDVNALLGERPSNTAITRLKEDSAVEAWVRQGVALHPSPGMCEFCSNQLSPERLLQLQAHFSEAYEKVVREAGELARDLRAIGFADISLDELRVVPAHRDDFVRARQQFSAWLQWAKQIRDELAAACDKKRTSVESVTSWQGDLTRASEGVPILGTANQAIESHNSALRGVDAGKAQARVELERHYAAAFLVDAAVEQVESDIRDLARGVSRARTLQARLNSAIDDLDARTSQSSIGASRLGELVKYLLAGSDLEVTSVGDASLQVMRAGHPAVQLSEGERTAIGFAYFLTTLEGGGATIGDTIVFVDDPVSSLDANHIFAVFALIVERLSKAEQLFVATHNMELFNLLKSKWLQRNRGGPSVSMYQAWRSHDTAGQPRAELRDLPTLLRDYKSEYEFVFSRLDAFASASAPSLAEAYTAANLLRKFLEAYLGFRKAVPRSWSEKLDLLLDSPEARREVQKFADEESHLQSLGRALDHQDLVATAQRTVVMVMDGLRVKDPDHYKALVDVVEASAS